MRSNESGFSLVLETHFGMSPVPNLVRLVRVWTLLVCIPSGRKVNLSPNPIYRAAKIIEPVIKVVLSICVFRVKGQHCSLRLTPSYYTTFSLGLGKLGTNLGGLEFDSSIALIEGLQWIERFGANAQPGLFSSLGRSLTFSFIKPLVPRE